MTLSKSVAATLLCAGTFFCASQSEAQPFYWQPYPPVIVGSHYDPPAGLVIGGWWNSPVYGRTDIRICRLSDNLGRWSYGGYHAGACNYYSPLYRRGHAVSIGFDLIGGDHTHRWISPLSNGYRRWTLSHPFAEDREPLGAPSQLPHQGQHTTLAQQSELESLCRILQADGAFIGTLMDGTCFASLQGTDLISADYEVIEIERD